VRQADWSPDGSQLAIIREVEGKDRLEYPIGNVLYEVSGNLSDLRISPNGERIAVFEHPQKGDDRGSVNIIDLDGGKNMLSDGYWSARGLAWSPDSKEVLFSASLSGGNYMIFAVTLDGSRRIVDQSPGGLVLQDVASDGRWLATRIDFRYTAMVHTASTEDDRDLSWLRTSHSKVLSQDGQTLLFVETSIGNNYAVCLRKTDGSPLVRLGEGMPTDLSPDGKWVLVIVPTKPQQLSIYPTGAGETRQIDRANIETYTSAQWFRDGKRILIGGNEPGEGARFFVQDLGGGGPRPITPEGTRDGRLSPDGKLILARGAGRKYSLYPIDGGEPRSVPWLTDADAVFQWGADSRFVFAYRGSTIPCRVERIDLETGRRELFAEMAPANRTGLLYVRPTFIADNQQSYAYTTYQQVSTLFATVRSE
jgi:Tol biopolymer transport system component